MLLSDVSVYKPQISFLYTKKYTQILQQSFVYTSISSAGPKSLLSRLEILCTELIEN